MRRGKMRIRMSVAVMVKSEIKPNHESQERRKEAEVAECRRRRGKMRMRISLTAMAVISFRCIQCQFLYPAFYMDLSISGSLENIFVVLVVRLFDCYKCA